MEEQDDHVQDINTMPPGSTFIDQSQASEQAVVEIPNGPKVSLASVRLNAKELAEICLGVIAQLKNEPKPKSNNGGGYLG